MNNTNHVKTVKLSSANRASWPNLRKLKGQTKEISLSPTSEISYYKLVQPKAMELAQRIAAKSQNLKIILSDYQTQKVTEYEIERCVRTLTNLHENSDYLSLVEKIDSIAVMLPSNLPLYSLIVFTIIPSFQSNSVYVRPNALLQDKNIISRIISELELDSLLPNVSIINTDHAGFKRYISQASLVIFTGNPSNAEKILTEMKEGSILVVNGSGHNPVVVTETADLEKAVEETMFLKSFNGGQDCAGPDAILVHEKIASKFIDLFQKQFSSIKQGSFQYSDTVVGPILRFSELQKFASIFYSNSKDIVSGGQIDFRNSIVSPTVIVRNIKYLPNYKEMFGPVAFIHPYKKDEDLSYYFEDADGQYNANRMYVTVFGHSDYISNRDDSVCPRKPGNVGIVLYNQTIHDIEIGYKPYGGYSLGASGIIKKLAKGTQRVSMPILIPEIIAKYLVQNKDLPSNEVTDNNEIPRLEHDSTRRIHPTIKDFQDLAKEVFGDKAVFGFAWTKSADQKTENNTSENEGFSTFICLKEHEDDLIQKKYIEGLSKICKKHEPEDRKIDKIIIVTLETLKGVVRQLSRIDLCIDKTKDFEQILWILALTGRKIGFFGDSSIMHILIKDSLPHLLRWSRKIGEKLDKINSCPKQFSQLLLSLNNEGIIKNLHLIVSLVLSHEENNYEQ